jgi:hypothetical protein
VRRAAFIVVLLASISASGAAPAHAKSWPVARVCGQTNCISVRHPAVDSFFEWWSVGFHDLAVPAPARYYAIRWHDDTFDVDYLLLYVPSRHIMSIWQSRVPPYPQAIGPYWRSVPRYEWRPLDRILSAISPHKAQPRWPKPPRRQR